MAKLSFRDVARRLDPVAPPTRLRGTARDVSLDWYRTLGGTVTQKLHRAMRATAESSIGLIDHPDKGLIQLTRWSDEARVAGRDRSFRAICERVLEGRAIRFLTYNTWLIDPPVQTPLDRQARIPEIGRALDEVDADIVALNEVFDKDNGHTINDAVSFPKAIERGPEGAGIEIGSGLHVMVRRPHLEVLRTETHVFEHAGGFPDNLSQKGVLFLEIDLGPGRLDLFVTHMYAPEANDDGFSETRRRQTAELGAFIKQHRSEGNIVMLAGDLNVDGRKNEYTRLLRMLFGPTDERVLVPTHSGTDDQLNLVEQRFVFDLELQDLWLTRGSRLGTTAKAEDFEDFAKICRVGDDGFCDDHETDGIPDDPSEREPGYRLDYVFLQKPSEQHDFTLDVSRIRRRPFWRGDGFSKARFADGPAPGPGVSPARIPNFLSDHLGLELTLIASPKDPD